MFSITNGNDLYDFISGHEKVLRNHPALYLVPYSFCQPYNDKQGERQRDAHRHAAVVHLEPLPFGEPPFNRAGDPYAVRPHHRVRPQPVDVHISVAPPYLLHNRRIPPLPYNHTVADKQRVRTHESVGVAGVDVVVFGHGDVPRLA